MSAETLREAARLMRERAEAATRTPWGTVTHDFGMANLTINGHSTFRCPDCGTNAETDEQNAEHIASWHPAAALAVADWLDRLHEFITGDEFDQDAELLNALDGGPDSPPLSDWPEVESALAVARAYLGESA